MKFKIKVTETYTNTFEVEAGSDEEAQARAEEMAIERAFPSDNEETCQRTFFIEEVQPSAQAA